MPTRSSLPQVFCFVLCLLFVSSFLTGCTSRAAGIVPLILLQPIKTFQLSNALRMEDAAADSDGNLYFLLSNHGQQFEIIRTNDSGEVSQTIAVPPPIRSTLKKITAASMGRVAVLFIGFNTPDIIDVCDGPSGRILNTFSPQQKLADFSYIGSQLIGLTASNTVISLDSDTSEAPVATSTVLPQPALLSAVDDQHVAVVGMVTAQLQFATLGSQPSNPLALVAPEIQGIQRPQLDPSEGSIAIVHTIASSNKEVFLGLTGGKRQEGAPVLQLDSNGVLQQRLKCVLPTFGQDPSKHTSYMLPGKLLASGNKILWISQAEKKAAEYIVPANQ